MLDRATDDVRAACPLEPVKPEWLRAPANTPPPPLPAPEALELARRGPDALPSLIAHLGDTRRTRLLLARPINVLRRPEDPKDPAFSQGWMAYMWAGFDENYQPRYGNRYRGRGQIRRMDLEGDYFATVGDISYGLIGQIVNRDLSPARGVPHPRCDNPLASAVSQSDPLDQGRLGQADAL